MLLFNIVIMFLKCMSCSLMIILFPAWTEPFVTFWLQIASDQTTKLQG